MKNIDKIIIDTSIFVNPAAFRFWDRKPDTALHTFILKAQLADIALYTPPSIWNEIGYFIELNRIPNKITSYIKKKSPKKYELPVPGLFLYELVEEMRERINKGLRIAEKYSKKSAENTADPGELKKSLRNEYRTAMREGILDSTQDVDILLLAREMQIPIATADEGLKDWAARLGLECLILEELQAILFDYQHRAIRELSDI